MKDKITLQRIEKLHPILRTEAKYIYDEILKLGIGVRFTDTLRTDEQQNRLYELGRTKPGKIVTYARGGESMHNYGLAIDFCLLIDNKKVSWNKALDLNNDNSPDWIQVVEVFEKYGWTWGGNWKFKDYPHFEKSFGLKINELQNLVKAGHIDNGYVKL